MLYRFNFVFVYSSLGLAEKCYVYLFIVECYAAIPVGVGAWH